MEYTFTKRMEMLEDLREKYPVIDYIEDIQQILSRVKEMRRSVGNDEYHKNNFEELQAKLKGFQNTLYGLSATNIEKQHLENYFEHMSRKK